MSNRITFDDDYKFGTREVWEFDTELTTSIIVPLSPRQYEIVEYAAANNGFTVNEFLRQGISLIFSTAPTNAFELGGREQVIEERKAEFARRGRESAFSELTEEFNEHHSKLVKVPVTEKAKAEYEWGKERYRYNTYVEFQMALKGITSRVFWSNRELMSDWHDHSM